MEAEVQTYRYAAVVEYNGGCFFGWQYQAHQPHLISVQAALETALAKIANHPIKVFAAGRTDTGVHATRQVIHFDTTAKRADYSWLMGTNTHLPQGVALQWIGQVDMEFHARFKAQARRYRYLINNAPAKQALLHDQLTWWRYPLDEQKMHQAAQCLVGQHDFTSFRAADCQAKTAVKTLHHISVRRFGSLIVLEVEARGFLYHMVRNIVGSLLPIGEGHKPVSWLKETLEKQDRTQAGITAPAVGLYFVGVHYPEPYQFIPCQPFGPMLLEPTLQLANREL